VWYSVLQCVAVCCNVLKYFGVCVIHTCDMDRHLQQDRHGPRRQFLCCSKLQCAAVCCSMLQCVAVCCSVLQCVVVCFSAMQCVSSTRVTWTGIFSKTVTAHVVKSLLQCIAVCCSVLQLVAVCCSALQCVAVCCSVLQCVAVCCSVLQCVAMCVINMSDVDRHLQQDRHGPRRHVTHELPLLHHTTTDSMKLF